MTKHPRLSRTDLVTVLFTLSVLLAALTYFLGGGL